MITEDQLMAWERMPLRPYVADIVRQLIAEVRRQRLASQLALKTDWPSLVVIDSQIAEEAAEMVAAGGFGRRPEHLNG